MDGIAIIGLAGRFPGARNATEFWTNLRNGVESISHFRTEELEVRDAARLAQDPSYVKARSILTDVDLFDAEFFGFYPQEAKFIAPQHRVFLECCWEAIEDAGYDPASDPGVTGVFAGCSPNSYFLRRIAGSREYVEDYTSAYQVGFYPTMLGTIADTMATRVAYKLNLKGPAMTLLAARSTSLVAVCQAAKSLLTYECDQALAGAVSITFPQKRGYLHQNGGMVSPDGHCRAFDEAAQGTVFGSGAGVVLLKRLEDAVRDHDHIYAVIKGSAVNNDGSQKVGFTTPSVDGQAAVMRRRKR
jgi:acyl transferase domain-containing protein